MFCCGRKCGPEFAVGSHVICDTCKTCVQSARADAELVAFNGETVVVFVCKVCTYKKYIQKTKQETGACPS